MTVPAIKRTAYHEAGHAVVGLVRGIPMQHVSIELEVIRTGGGKLAVKFGEIAYTPSGRTRGEIRSQDPSVILDHLVSLMAGSAAEQRLMKEATGKKPRPGDCGEAEDEQEARDLAIVFLNPCYGPKELKAFLSWARARAAAVLGWHWEAVCAVAAALEEHGHLTADQLAEIAAPALAEVPEYVRSR